MSRLQFPEPPFPRSHLVPLQPIGLETPFAESTESYVLRLAEEHRVTRYHIEALVSSAGPEPLYKGVSRQPFRVDSPLESAQEFCRRLASLTHVPAVEFMGLGWLATRLGFSGALRDHRAWCPQCIEQRRLDGGKPHLPLVWSLPLYENCLTHGGSMQSSCSHCSKRISVRREWAVPFENCPHCNSYLGRPLSQAGCTFQDLARRKARAVDQRAAIHLGDFIATAESMRNEAMFGAPDVSRLVASAVERGLARNESHLASIAGITKGTLNRLTCDPTARPSLDVLARLAVASDVALAGTFCPQLWREGSETAATVAPIPHSSRRGRPRISWDEVRRAANTELRSPTPRSPSALAKELRVDPSQFRRTFPEIANKLMALNKQYLVNERKALEGKLVIRIRDLLAKRAAGSTRRFPSLRTAASTLAIHRNNLDVRAAWEFCKANY